MGSFAIEYSPRSCGVFVGGRTTNAWMVVPTADGILWCAMCVRKSVGRDRGKRKPEK